jgi:hypothetical protein
MQAFTRERVPVLDRKEIYRILGRMQRSVR